MVGVPTSTPTINLLSSKDHAGSKVAAAATSIMRDKGRSEDHLMETIARGGNCGGESPPSCHPPSPYSLGKCERDRDSESVHADVMEIPSTIPTTFKMIIYYLT